MELLCIEMESNSVGHPNSYAYQTKLGSRVNKLTHSNLVWIMISQPVRYGGK